MSTEAFAGNPPLLRAGDQVTHFSVNTFDNGRIDYSAIWQQKNLLLVSVPASQAFHEYASSLADAIEQSPELQAQLVATADAIAGIGAPSVVIADRWGEIAFVAQAEDAANLPERAEVIAWLRFIQQRCPECEGEAR